MDMIDDDWWTWWIDRHDWWTITIYITWWMKHFKSKLQSLYACMYGRHQIWESTPSSFFEAFGFALRLGLSTNNELLTYTVFTRWSDCGVEPGRWVRSVFWGCIDPRLHSNPVHGADPATGADRTRARCLHYEISRASVMWACMCTYLFTVLYFFPEFRIVSHCRECVHWCCIP